MTKMKQSGTTTGTRRKGPSRRSVLSMLGATAGGIATGQNIALAQTPAAPAVRKKVKVVYWNWADNPNHQKISVDSVAMFNKSQNFVEVELDAQMAVGEVRKKLVVAYAAGGAPDICMAVQYWVQDLFSNGIIAPLDPYFDKWDAKTDYFPNLIEKAHSKPGQPLLYLPIANLVYFLYYRADWTKELGLQPPETYDQMLALGKAMTKAPDRYGYAVRGQPYQAIEIWLPILRSAGVKMVDEKGNVDFDSPAAIDMVSKWIGQLTKDKSAPPTAVNDGMREIYSLLQNGKAGMWVYASQSSPALTTTLGDNIQGVVTPRIGSEHFSLNNPEGPLMTSSCKEKEAAFEFMKFMSSGEAALLYTRDRVVPPARKSLAALDVFQNNRFIKLSVDTEKTWWSPPYEHEYWAPFQDRIAPYWQEALRETITPKQFCEQGARLLRGEG